MSQDGTQYHRCAVLGDVGRPPFVDRTCDTNVMGRYVRLRRPLSAHEGHGMNFCEVQVYAYQYEGECSRLIWFYCVNNPRIQYIVCHFVTCITILQIVFCYVTTRPATLYFLYFAGIFLHMGSANGRRRYTVKLPLIGWSPTPNDPCFD